MPKPTLDDLRLKTPQQLADVLRWRAGALKSAEFDFDATVLTVAATLLDRADCWLCADCQSRIDADDDVPVRENGVEITDVIPPTCPNGKAVGKGEPVLLTHNPVTSGASHLREQIARIIDPRSWSVLDGFSEQGDRLTDEASLTLADRVLALLSPDLRKQATAIAQLRHAYAHLAAEGVTNQREFADGLIAPAIRYLESVNAQGVEARQGGDAPCEMCGGDECLDIETGRAIECPACGAAPSSDESPVAESDAPKDGLS